MVLLRLALRLLVAAALTALSAWLAHLGEGGLPADAAGLFALLGSLTFFFAEPLSCLTWQSHGRVAKASPAAAFRVLGVLAWIIAGVCIACAW